MSRGTYKNRTTLNAGKENYPVLGKAFFFVLAFHDRIIEHEKTDTFVVDLLLYFY